MCTYQHDDDVDAIQICRISEFVERFTNIDIALTIETCARSGYVELSTDIEAPMPQYPLGDAVIKTPALQDINILLCNIDFEHHVFNENDDL